MNIGIITKVASIKGLYGKSKRLLFFKVGLELKEMVDK